MKVGFPEVRGISSAILTISMLIKSVGLSRGGLVSEDRVSALTDVKVRFALLLFHDGVSLLSGRGDGSLICSTSVESVEVLVG